MKKYIYYVKGYAFQDTEAWGQAWKQAKAIAIEAHCPIYRTVINGEKEKYEFLAKGYVFINEKFYAPAKLYIF